MVARWWRTTSGLPDPPERQRHEPICGSIVLLQRSLELAHRTCTVARPDVRGRGSDGFAGSNRRRLHELRDGTVENQRLTSLRFEPDGG